MQRFTNVYETNITSLQHRVLSRVVTGIALLPSKPERNTDVVDTPYSSKSLTSIIAAPVAYQSPPLQPSFTKFEIPASPAFAAT